MSTERIGEKRFSRRGIIASIGGVLLANYYLRQALETNPQPIWKYKSDPPHPHNLDVVVRTLTDPLMFYLADGVVTHAYDWIEEERKEGVKGVALKGDLSAFDVNSPLGRILFHSRWGWQNAYIVGIDQDSIRSLENKEEMWQVAFGISERKLKKCRILIPLQEEVKMLVGRSDVEIYTLDQDGNELPSFVTGPVHRRDKRFKHARLL